MSKRLKQTVETDKETNISVFNRLSGGVSVFPQTAGPQMPAKWGLGRGGEPNPIWGSSCQLPPDNARYQLESEYVRGWVVTARVQLRGKFSLLREILVIS
ncbi:hypothetical protein J6590_013658 [Homalodisca vitripennis]|nr:hypothetical protein J6590_013658 [Homalodisca vitripennis]